MAQLGLRAGPSVLSSGPRSTRFSQQPSRHSSPMSTMAYVQVPQGTKADLLCSGLNYHQHFHLNYFAGFYTLWIGFAQKVLSSRQNFCRTFRGCRCQGKGPFTRETNLPSIHYKVPVTYCTEHLCKYVHFLGKELSNFVRFSQWDIWHKSVGNSEESVHDYISPTQIAIRSSPTHFREEY